MKSKLSKKLFKINFIMGYFEHKPKLAIYNITCKHIIKIKSPSHNSTIIKP